jgi:hypothetical protein
MPDAQWERGDDVPLGLTDPLTALSFSAMPVAQLAENHRGLVATQREVDHWRRLILARIDLAVASIADLEDLLVPPNAASYGCPGTPPPGLRALLGIARLEELEERLGETALLMQLRRALDDLTVYHETLEAVTDEAANMLAFRLGMVA